MVDASVSTRLLPSVLNYYALGRDLSCVMLIQRVREKEDMGRSRLGVRCAGARNPPGIQVSHQSDTEIQT